MRVLRLCSRFLLLLAFAGCVAVPGLQAAPSPGSAIDDHPGLGALRFENGFPSVASAEKLDDELDRQRATQACLGALPVVAFKVLHDAQAKPLGVRNGDVPRFRTLQDKAEMLIPNISAL